MDGHEWTSACMHACRSRPRGRSRRRSGAVARSGCLVRCPPSTFLARGCCSSRSYSQRVLATHRHTVSAGCSSPRSCSRPSRRSAPRGCLAAPPARFALARRGVAAGAETRVHERRVSFNALGSPARRGVAAGVERVRPRSSAHLRAAAPPRLATALRRRREARPRAAAAPHAPALACAFGSPSF